jgi:hypothetical protein
MRAPLVLALMLAGTAPALAQATTSSIDPAAAVMQRLDRLQKSWDRDAAGAMATICEGCGGRGPASRTRAPAHATPPPALVPATPPVEEALPALDEPRLVLPEDRVPVLGWFGIR